jgi:hypothetical protein
MKWDQRQQTHAETRRDRRKRLLGNERECARCGEADVMCLSRTDIEGHEGQVLCRNCRAEAIVPSPSEYQGPAPHTNQHTTCTLCPYGISLAPAGARVIEQHHPLGRAHNPSFVIPLCLNCHTKLTELQRCLGTDLTAQANDLARLTAAITSALAYVLGVYSLTRHTPPYQRADRLLLAAVTSLVGLYEIATSSCSTK